MIKFIEEATSSLEQLKKYVEVLGSSGKLPRHFYKLDKQGAIALDSLSNPIVNIGAVVMCVTYGLEIGLTISQSLTQLAPTEDGGFYLKGDAARALIFKSGELESWSEQLINENDRENAIYRITFKRKNFEEKIVEFSANDAKRMRLWVSEDLAKKYPKFKDSPWYKTWGRMLMYRCLGFLNRDYFADITKGLYTWEEANDLTFNTVKFETEAGITVDLDKSAATAEANEKLADKMTPKSEAPEENFVKTGGDPTVVSSEAQVFVNPDAEHNKFLGAEAGGTIPPNQPIAVETGKAKQSIVGDLFAVSFEQLQYESVIGKKSPVELVEEFKKLPFTIDNFVKAGGKKDSRTVKFILSCHFAGQLDLGIEKLKLNKSILYGN